MSCIFALLNFRDMLSHMPRSSSRVSTRICAGFAGCTSSPEPVYTAALDRVGRIDWAARALRSAGTVEPLLLSLSVLIESHGTASLLILPATHPVSYPGSAPAVRAAACRFRVVLLQTLNSENMEDYVGYELPAKFLEVDEVRPAWHIGPQRGCKLCMHADEWTAQAGWRQRLLREGQLDHRRPRRH
jgi:hypothetical protein